MKRLGMLLAVVAVVGLVYASSGFAAQSGTPSTRPIRGQITKIEGKTLTISVAGRGGAAPTEKTVTAEDTTEVFADTTVKLADVKVGDQVRITSGTQRYSGEVTKIDGKTLTIKGRRNEQTVTLDDTAVITGSVKSTLNALKVSQYVNVTLTADGKVARIDIRQGPPPARTGTPGQGGTQPSQPKGSTPPQA
jgi:preprotein translocase subunit YajC